MEKFDGCQTSEIIANFYLTQTTFLYPLHYSIKYNKIKSKFSIQTVNIIS